MAPDAIFGDEGPDGLLELPIQRGSIGCAGSGYGCQGEHDGKGSGLHAKLIIMIQN